MINLNSFVSLLKFFFWFEVICVKLFDFLFKYILCSMFIIGPSPRGTRFMRNQNIENFSWRGKFLVWTDTFKSFHTSSLNLWLIQVFDDGWTWYLIIWKVTLLETSAGLTIYWLMDVKNMHVWILESKKSCMSDFYQPERTVVLLGDGPFNRS